MNYLLDRLREDSTWRGILMLLTAAGVSLDPAQANAIIALGLALVGLINVLRRQK
jgi:hypothetical protein